MGPEGFDHDGFYPTGIHCDQVNHAPDREPQTFLPAKSLFKKCEKLLKGIGVKASDARNYERHFFIF
jgi:hypothetical protein